MSDVEGADDASKVRERSIYLALKIKALKEEVGTLKAEEAEVGAKMRAAKDKKTPEMKTLRSRLMYLRLRPVEAQAEMQAAAVEKERLVGMLRPHGA